MANDIYDIVSNCHICANIDTTIKYRSRLQKLSATRLLEPAAMDMLKSLLDTTKSTQHNVVFTDRFLKLNRRVSAAKITTSNFAGISVKHA